MRVFYLLALFCIRPIRRIHQRTLFKIEAPFLKLANVVNAKHTISSFLNKAKPFSRSVKHAVLILLMTAFAMIDAQAVSPYRIYKGQHVSGDFTNMGSVVSAEMNFLCSTPYNSCSINDQHENNSSWVVNLTMTQTQPPYAPVSWKTSLSGPIRWYCPSGFVQSGSTCVRGPGPDFHKDNGPPDCCEGNPINATSGNKFQSESDYQGNGLLPLKWVRTYNSSGTPSGTLNMVAGSKAGGDSVFDPSVSAVGGNMLVPATTVGKFSNSPIGIGWRHTYDRTLVTQSSDVTTATLNRHDGKVLTFQLTGTDWIPDAGDTVTRLVSMTDGGGQLSGWQYTNDHNELETYDAVGKLLSIQSPSGWRQILHYNDQNLLDSVTDSAGRILTISYDTAGRVSEFKDPANGSYLYEYNASGSLVKVTYPDMHVRQYVYENASFPNALTGIIDENGTRFAKWAYDATTGKAISSEHANGVGKVTLTFGATVNSATGAGGATRNYTIQVINGYSKARSITETCGTNCSRNRSINYDTHGNVTNSTDWNGNVTTYSYDPSRNLEIQRVEASGTSQARTITTEWHPTYRLPTKVAEPKRITTNTYDAKGNLLSSSVQATTDTTGAQGVAAATTGTAAVWSYTYNDVGQVLTTTDPRGYVTAYGYDDQGNLASIKNAVGQATTLSNYDANGRVGRIVDANGLVTELDYSPRGWLTAKTTGGETTRYAYDGVGQLTRVTLPDGAAINYTYDDAHRLTDVADSMGNNIHYTLDAMGNRIAEQARDASGALARQVTRVYDALNRLQQITGGVQ